MILTADFHNHSCLSPCASLDLSPRRLVDRAAEQGVAVLALTDHNSARNTPAFERLCRDRGLLPLCGLEVTTAEALHCLCLFAASAQALAFGAWVEDHLTPTAHDPRQGSQVVVDENDLVLDEVGVALRGSTDLSLAALGRACQAAGGLFVPAHIDRPRDSVLSQLGRLPDLPYDALEVRRDAAGLETRGVTLVRGSDAHYVDDVGRRTCRLDVAGRDFAGVRSALRAGLASWS